MKLVDRRSEWKLVRCRERVCRVPLVLDVYDSTVGICGTLSHAQRASVLHARTELLNTHFPRPEYQSSEKYELAQTSLPYTRVLTRRTGYPGTGPHSYECLPCAADVRGKAGAGPQDGIYTVLGLRPSNIRGEFTGLDYNLSIERCMCSL